LARRRLGFNAGAAIESAPSHGTLKGVIFVSTWFGRALLQIYLDHISFHVVNRVARRHDAFGGAKNCPSFPAIPRPLFGGPHDPPAWSNADLQPPVAFPSGSSLA
jgi:hypothetical protein